MHGHTNKFEWPYCTFPILWSSYLEMSPLQCDIKIWLDLKIENIKSPKAINNICCKLNKNRSKHYSDHFGKVDNHCHADLVHNIIMDIQMYGT